MPQVTKFFIWNFTAKHYKHNILPACFLSNFHETTDEILWINYNINEFWALVILNRAMNSLFLCEFPCLLTVFFYWSHSLGDCTILFTSLHTDILSTHFSYFVHIQFELLFSVVNFLSRLKSGTCLSISLSLVYAPLSLTFSISNNSVSFYVWFLMSRINKFPGQGISCYNWKVNSFLWCLDYFCYVTCQFSWFPSFIQINISPYITL